MPPADRRAQLQALADWITRGPTPERVRLAALLFPDGVEAIATDSWLTVHQVRAYMEGRLCSLRSTSLLKWGGDTLTDRLTGGDGPDEWDRCLDALEAMSDNRRSLYMIPLHYHHRIEDARRWRLAARAAGWRLP